MEIREMENGKKEWGKKAGAVLKAVREQKPLIHHITNFVVMNETANITLATGALPVMAHAKEEAAEMAGQAAALVLNIGTLWPEQVEAMIIAGKRANELGSPVVLDPVGAGATSYRTETAKRLLEELKISIVRGNSAEIGVLAGAGGDIKGVEAVGDSANAMISAKILAGKFNCVTAVTGPVDIVVGKESALYVLNGHPMMSAVTGTGCMATAIIGAFAAAHDDCVEAAAFALAAYGLAGQIAASISEGPGTFHAKLYDSMANLTEDYLTDGAKIEDA